MARKWLGVDPSTADESRIYTGVHFGQCQLTLVNTSLNLAPFGGQYLSIAGINRKIPSGGISLAPTGLTSATTYYIYAQYSAGAMSLLASTTTWAISTNAANVGVAVMSGDYTKTLVGIARITTAIAWIDTTTVRGVRSYYNRVPIDVRTTFSAVTTTATTFAQVGGTTIVNTMQWADEVAIATVNGTMYSATINTSIYATIGVDGVATNPGYADSEETVAGSYPMSFSASYMARMSEGLHAWTLMGQVSANTATYTGALGVVVVGR